MIILLEIYRDRLKDEQIELNTDTEMDEVQEDFTLFGLFILYLVLNGVIKPVKPVFQ